MRLRRLRGGIWTPPPSTFNFLWYVFFSVKNFCSKKKSQRFRPGHVLCASCCTTIVEKTSPRLTPACPFCREHFTSDSIRLIRMDFTTSGWSTPRRVPVMDTFNNFNPEVLQRKTAHLSNGSSKTRIEVRRLEDKVAKAAAKKCSVEEVAALYRELEEFLVNDKEEFVRPFSFLCSVTLPTRVAFSPSHSSESFTHDSTRKKNFLLQLLTLIDTVVVIISQRSAAEGYSQESRIPC